MTQNIKKKGLGKGLSALLGNDRPEFDRTNPVNVQGQESGFGATRSRLPIAFLERNPAQPRRIFTESALEELAASIKEKGLLQPVLVREISSNRFEIVAGERRWRACQKAGLNEIPVVIKDLDDDDVLQIAIIENIQREDLTPVEEGQAFERLMKDFGHTQSDVSDLVGKSRSHVANLMRLLTLPEAVQTYVDEKKLSMGHARALIGAPDAVALAGQVIAKGLSVRQVEKLVSNQKGGIKPQRNRVKLNRVDKDADTLALEKDLSAAVGTKVTITHLEDGSGQLILHYTDLESLDTLCGKFGVCGID